MPLQDELQEKLHRVSQRAVAAFTIGTAEWIVYRFGRLCQDSEPAQRIEAAWAQLVSFRYSTNNDIDRDKWRGPVRGPIGTALRRVIFALDQAERNGEPAWRAGRASKLAEHVLPDPSPYRQWRNSILDVFQKLYPIDLEETLGDVVPREVLRLGQTFEVNQTDAVINAFLSRLDYRTNSFLNSPEAMIRQGFAGRPYLYSYAEDRKARYAW